MNTAALPFHRDVRYEHLMTRDDTHCNPCQWP